MKITLIVPTLNEIDGMKAIMPLIKKQWYDQLIILDGGSTDGTVEYAESQGYFVYVQKQKGFRHAYNEVLPYIEGDVVVTFSPDGNSVPEAIPQLCDKMKEGYDMVIGSRYLQDAKSDDDDFITSFGNWLFTRTVNILHGGSYTDVMVILRAYRTQLIYDLELHTDEAYSTAEKLFRTKISWEPLLSVRAAKKKLKITEIPADEPERIGGERKLQILRWGAAYYFQFIRECFCWR
ncbi:MAG: glycosyltransferase family 2 protein [Anaerohalosphaera sp.]|nr:glycosyltransferase family 2 protein [Anaerohalosphaera sp.]